MKVILLSLFIPLLFTSALADTDKLTFSRGVKSAHQEQIQTDLERLQRLNLDSAGLLEWLYSRVRYIVDQKSFKKTRWTLGKQLYVLAENVTYHGSTSEQLNTGLPGLTDQIAEENDEAMTVMSNLGAAVYIQGKKENKLYQMKIPVTLLDYEKVTINSPRAGVIQIGPGLFDRRFNINNSDPASWANSIHRLGVLFHEARHSDGSADNLGFTHIRCPKGHDYEGLYACDLYSNGAYAVSAKVTEEMMLACEDQCSAREKEILKLTILDSKNRILGKKTGQASPENLE